MAGVRYRRVDEPAGLIVFLASGTVVSMKGPGLLELGSSIEGKYKVLERLASGGMGEVYKVLHVHLQQPRVIKLLRPELAEDQDAARRFHREARTATQIEHPSVAMLHDFSRLPNGSFYMVWEYIDGQDLSSWLREHGPFPLDQALDLAVQGLSGLEAIHAAQVIHRDISPDNLMLSRSRTGHLQLHVIDLGLAKSLSDGMALEDSGAGGKLLYCSPEQAGLIEGVRPDHLSDLYSFALVIYEMLSGRLPFDSLEGGLVTRFRTKPVSLRKRGVEVPEALDRVLMRALSLERRRRYQDARSFRIALQQIPTQVEQGSERAELSQAVKRLGVIAELVNAGKLEQARTDLDALAAQQPNLFGLAELQKRLELAEAGKRRMQSMQTREMVEQYLALGQQRLAELALVSLSEIAPDHPELDELWQRVRTMAAQQLEKQTLQQMLDGAMRLVAAGDVEAARAELPLLEERDAVAARKLSQAIDARDREMETSVKVDKLREDIEKLIDTDRLVEAEEILDELTRFEVPKVVVDVYRNRLQERRLELAQRTTSELIEARFEQAVGDEAWNVARRLARDLEVLMPESSRPGEMLALVSEREAEVSKRRSINEGIAQLESFISKGRLEEASVSIRVLRRMNPDDPRVEELERRLQSATSSS